MRSLTKPVRESLVRARLAKGREDERWGFIRCAMHDRLQGIVYWNDQLHEFLRLFDCHTEAISFDMPRPKSHDV
jgi:hypothetical protein